MEWIVHEWDNKFQVVEAQVTSTHKPGISMTGQRIIAKEITKANANLIAAAPEMYEALKDIRQIIKLYSPQSKMGGDIRLLIQKVLAKAEANNASSS